MEKTERLDQFASMASHELRNPLNILRMYLSMARETGQSGDFDQCEQAVDRMNRQIDDFLTLARKGSAPVEPEPIELSRAVADCWEVVAVPTAEIRVETQLRIYADEDKLFEVLENLFRNAVEHGSTSQQPAADDAVEHGSTGSRASRDDATEHGGSDVTITVGELDDGANNDRTGGADDERSEGEPPRDRPVGGFYVEDDGPGIPERKREKVFEDGYSTSQHGTGFGLTIISRIVEAHGWEVRVTDGSAGGARFEVSGVELAVEAPSEPE